MSVSLSRPADWTAALRVHARREYGDRAAAAVGLRTLDRMTPADVATAIAGGRTRVGEPDTNGQRATVQSAGIAGVLARRYRIDPDELASETVRRLTPARRGRPADVLAWIALADRDPIAARALESAHGIRPVPRGRAGWSLLWTTAERAAANLRRDADRRPEPTDAAPDATGGADPAGLVAPDLWNAAWHAANVLAPDAATGRIRSMALALYCATESATGGQRDDGGRTAAAILNGAAARAGIGAGTAAVDASRGRTALREYGKRAVMDAWRAAVAELGQRDPANPDRPALTPVQLAALRAVESLADTTPAPAPTDRRADGLRDTAPEDAAPVRVTAEPNRGRAVVRWIALADR